MIIKKLQKEQKEWSIKNRLKGDGNLMLLGIMEELGELSHAHLKDKQGIRTNEKHKEAKIDAIGDIVTYIAAYCNAENIDMEKAILDTWDTVKKRDWIKNKETGV